MKTVAELVKELLELPQDLIVMALDNMGPTTIGSCRTYTVTQNDEDDSGSCDGLVGREIVVIHID
jgi:hypothetical protein